LATFLAVLAAEFQVPVETACEVFHVRASSVIENLNSRLRNCFFLRRHLGRDYLAVPVNNPSGATLRIRNCYPKTHRIEPDLTCGPKCLLSAKIPFTIR
jgi:hypothetical protein